MKRGKFVQCFNQYFKAPTNSNCILAWKSKHLSGEMFKPPGTSDNILVLGMIFSGAKPRVKFDGNYWS